MRYDGSGILDLVDRPLLLVVESGLLQKSRQQLPRESQQQAAHIGFSDTGTVCKTYANSKETMCKLLWSASFKTFILLYVLNSML